MAFSGAPRVAAVTGFHVLGEITAFHFCVPWWGVFARIIAQAPIGDNGKWGAAPLVRSEDMAHGVQVRGMQKGTKNLFQP